MHSFLPGIRIDLSNSVTRIFVGRIPLPEGRSKVQGLKVQRSITEIERSEFFSSHPSKLLNNVDTFTFSQLRK